MWFCTPRRFFMAIGNPPGQIRRNVYGPRFLSQLRLDWFTSFSRTRILVCRLTEAKPVEKDVDEEEAEPVSS